MNERTVDWAAVVRTLVHFIVAVTVAVLAQPLIHGNSDAVNLIVTVFSILAGFLIAIIAIIGDPGLLRPGSWRAAEVDRPRLVGKLIRQKWLFHLYLLTLTLIFASTLVPESYPLVVSWTERAFLCLGSFAFLLSFQLPGTLVQIQKDKIDAHIEYRRSGAGIKKESSNPVSDS
ncbi:MAG: hypothetical protein DHS20C12_11810 [Pseudohongiella sp.]|nr:MAG: hypothetical protein DHS20C12_11810 [Pseudohongiella sp.]